MVTSPEHDKMMLTLKLWDFKEKCEALGLRVHDKPGKLIEPTTNIEWLGWVIDTIVMRITMTDQKREKGLALCEEMLRICNSSEMPRARFCMEFIGFLNFIAHVMRQAQPYTRELTKCVVDTQVFTAWSSGRRSFNPPVVFSAVARQDIEWWRRLFQTTCHRKIHHACGTSFIWHRKLPNLESFRRIAWDCGLLVVLGLDASGGIGWGITVGDRYAQGRWKDAEAAKHINWKELKCYDMALDVLPSALANKIVYVKSDNVAALHYINAGRGRIPELADLARSIRSKEIHLGLESVGIHILEL